MKVLHHFSKNPFILNPNFEYNAEPVSMRPRGLWLSDESNGSGWSDYCKSTEVRIEDLQHKKEIHVDDEKCICLNSYEDIYRFNEEYKIFFEGFPLGLQPEMIDWEKVKQEYSGIIITPYCYKSRHEFLWYYAWDCESGCIWDTSILKLG